MDNNSERVFYAFLSFASFRSSRPASVAGDSDEPKTLGTNGAPGSLSGILCLRHTMSITEGDKYAEASQEDAES